MDLKTIAVLFGSNKDPSLLLGGQGTTHRSGNIVLKPTDNKEESEELAEIINKRSPSKKLRIPRPIKSINGNWVEKSYVAWEFLEGKHLKRKYREKIQICDWFNESFEGVAKPKFIKTRQDPWSIADRIAWGETNKKYDAAFQEIIDGISGKLELVKLESQIIHGDISGNIIFSEENVPGVIDLTIYWRPRDFAKALLVVDAITWEGADANIYELVKDVPQIDQLILRAGLRRIIENPGHVEHFRKNKQKALAESKKYYETLKLLFLL